MKLELRKRIDGTGFVICICGEKTGQQLVVPLAQDLSERIDVMLRQDGFKPELSIPELLAAIPS
jgi:hypothetical protein